MADDGQRIGLQRLVPGICLSHDRRPLLEPQNSGAGFGPATSRCGWRCRTWLERSSFYVAAFGVAERYRLKEHGTITVG